MGGLIHWRDKMKKVIILTFLLIMISSSLVFSIDNPYNSQSYYMTYQNTSGQTFWVTSDSQITYEQGVGFRGINLNWNYGTNISLLNFSYTPTVISSTHDVLIHNTSTVFFQALSPLEVGMEGALPNLLQSLLVILPIILGMCLLVIGFRKAWELLSRILVRA